MFNFFKKSPIRTIIVVAAILFVVSLAAYKCFNVKTSFLEFFITSLSAFSTATAVSIYYFQLDVMNRTILENKKIADNQMEQAIMPEILIDDLSFNIRDLIEGNTLLGVECYHMNLSMKANLLIRNCGFGIAKNITIEWNYDFDKLNDYLRKHNVSANTLRDTEQKISFLVLNQREKLELPKQFLKIACHECNRVMAWYNERPPLKVIITYFNNYDKKYEVEANCVLKTPLGPTSTEASLSFENYKKRSF